MKSSVGPFVAAIVLVLAGSGLWLAGRTETRLADVHKELATLQYADAQSVGAAVERSQSLALERRVPMLGKAAETDARNVRAAAGYWRTDYAAIAPQHDANGVITETDPAILLLNANAAFRASQAAGDRLDIARRLDTVVKSYAEVLKAPACGAERPRLRRPRRRRRVQLRVRDPHPRHAGQAARAGGQGARENGQGRRRDRSALGPNAARQARRAAGSGRHESVQDRDPEARRGAKGRAGRRARADRRFGRANEFRIPEF